jgi:hypothetical protein
MSEMRLIGITGLKGSGKSTLARHIESLGYKRIPFAETLKDMLKAFGLTGAQVTGSEKEIPCDILCGQTPRYAMQTLGTEWGRAHIGEQVWLRSWQHKMELAHRDGRSVVVDDARFPNEAALVTALGGKMIRVTRPGCAVTAHASENQILDLPVDVEIANTGTLDDLFAEFHRAISA